MLRWGTRRRRGRESVCMRAYLSMRVCLYVYVLYVFVCVFVCMGKDADVEMGDKEKEMP